MILLDKWILSRATYSDVDLEIRWQNWLKKF